jgi:type II secretory pathway pseudopilin PulG
MGGLLSLHRGQRGLSAVEMIITMALTGIILGAIFSVYLLLYRVQTTWQDKSQARATGLVAEQSLQRDLERYRLTSKVKDRIVLNAASSDDPSGFSVEWVRDSTTSRLSRTVKQSGNVVSSIVVAHGIQELESWCSNESPVAQGPGTGVWVDPALFVKLRNGSSCKALSVAMRVNTQ